MKKGEFDESQFVTGLKAAPCTSDEPHEGRGKKQGKANLATARAKKWRGVCQGSLPKGVKSRAAFSCSAIRITDGKALQRFPSPDE
jgi:hypothetical protein